MGNSIEDIYQEGREDGLIEGREEGREEGLEQGHKEAAHNVARTMLMDGFDSKIIQKYFKLSTDEVNQLIREENAEYKTESDKH